ncbi:MAG: iron chelate uptake ABC transporter family permease subunit, partial [Clostridia bacterium]|nr:iron chelate uptake ABC transporter family permease subunit [Clostridia bacterium]
MDHIRELEKRKYRDTAVIVILAAAVIALSIACLFVGSSRMTFREALEALLGGGTSAQSRIIWKIRVPRVLAAVIAGAGL